MHPTRHLALLACLSLLSSASALRAGLLNGSFEEDTYVSANESALIRDFNGNTGNPLTSWVLGGTTGGSTATASSIDLVNGNHTGLGLTAYAGSQFVDFNSRGGLNGGFISQSFATSVGTQYTVSYAVGRAGLDNGANAVALRAEAVGAGASQDTTVTSTSWTSRSFTFTAAGATTTLKFIDITIDAPTIASNYDVTLDAVSVTAVPEPASIATVIGASLGAFGVWRRRSRTTRR